METAQKRPVISLNWIVILRVMMGLVFMTTWFVNLNKGLYGDGYLPFIQGWADGTEFRWYATFLYNVIIPNNRTVHTYQCSDCLVICYQLVSGQFRYWRVAVDLHHNGCLIGCYRINPLWSQLWNRHLANIQAQRTTNPLPVVSGSCRL